MGEVDQCEGWSCSGGWHSWGGRVPSARRRHGPERPPGPPRRPLPPRSAPAAPSTPAAEPIPAATVAPAWPPTTPAELPDRDPVRAGVLRAWSIPSPTLADRAGRAQRAGFEIGLTELDAVARGVLEAEALGSESERAAQAVRLAPGLPAAHAALARARFAAGDLRGAALSLREALDVAPEHLEARLWLDATGCEALALACFGLALLFLALAAVGSLPALVRGLSASRLALPGPSALAAIACGVLLAAWLEGAAGVALAFAVLAVASGSPAKRALAAGTLLLGLLALHPLLERAARARLTLAVDPVAVAAYQVEHALATPAELGRLLAAAESDPLAGRALALYAKRSGDLPTAAAYFARLVDQGADGDVLNNAANVELKLGRSDYAIELYLRAESKTAAPVVLFNLSQAYGAAIRLDDQDKTLERAQAAGPRVVDQLGALFSHSADTLVADAPLAAERVVARAAEAPESRALAHAWRARFAPGVLGGSALAAALACVLALAAGVGAGLAAQRVAGPNDFYADIARMLRSGVGDSAQRVAQLTRLRRRHARVQWLLTGIALLVPGAAGLRWGRPLLGLLGAACFSGALALAHADAHALVDPLAVGALRELLVQGAYGALASLYVVATGLAFWLRAEE